MFKRITLFLLTNMAVLALVSIVMSLLGIRGDQFGGLLVFAALFGFGGSIISLLASKWVAKRFTGARVIEQPRTEVEQWLVSTVRRQAEAAGIGHPEVAIYEAPEINASPPAPIATMRWSQCPPGCWPRCRATRPKRCSGTRSATSPMATW